MAPRYPFASVGVAAADVVVWVFCETVINDQIVDVSCCHEAKETVSMGNAAFKPSNPVTETAVADNNTPVVRKPIDSQR
jgi:hypothetical protein